MKISLIIGLASVLMGCASSPQGVWLTADQAKVLAVRLANEQAETICHHQPFQAGQPPRFEAGRWIWSDSRGFGSGDIQVKVELAADGSTNRVAIMLMDNKNPVSNKQ